MSGTGLNLYVMLLAKTGVGKEGGAQGIDRLVAAVRSTVPMIDDFLGPAAFASGQGLIRTLDEKQCFMSILGEFGITLQTLSDTNANANSLMLRRVLLDLYSKSGRSGTLRSTAYSDKEKNTKTLHSPALTILGESTPEEFYAGLSMTHVANGLIPRFLILEYEGDRPDRNTTSAFAPPPDWIVTRLADFASTVLTMANNQSWSDVHMGSEAAALMDAFDRECDEQIRGGGADAIRQLWNRAHLKAIRLASVLAVADRHHEPVVNEVEALWAIDTVRRDTMAIVKRFESGDIGEGETKQGADLDRVIDDFFTCDAKHLVKYQGTSTGWVEMRNKGVVPHTYLARRTAGLSAYRKHRGGARAALKDALADLVSGGRLQEVAREQMATEFGTTGSGYYFVERRRQV